MTSPTPAPRSTRSPFYRFPLAACALLLAFAASSCPSGLSSLGVESITVPEGAPVSVTSTGIDLGMVLVDPDTGIPLEPQFQQVTSTTVAVEGAGLYTFVAFVTRAKADDADGVGGDLDEDSTPDTNGADDIFLAALDAFGVVRDVVLVTRSSLATGANACAASPLACRACNGSSANPSLAYMRNPFGPEPTTFPACANGTLSPLAYVRVAFDSTASDLVPCQFVAGNPVPQDVNGAMRDVFLASVHVYVVDGVVDLRLYSPQCNYGQVAVCNQFPTEIVSWSSGTNAQASNGVSELPSLSPDGNYVAFESEATNLVTGDTNDRRDVFGRPMPRPIPNHGSESGPGYFFVGAFTTQGADPNGFCFVCHGNRRFTRAISKPLAAGEFANGASFRPRFFAGSGARFLTFESEASNLIGGDTNGVRDVFYGRIDPSGVDQLARASVRTGGIEATGGASRNASLAVLDASTTPAWVRVAFESDKTDLVPAVPAGSTTNAYLFDSRAGGTTTLLNQWIGPAGPRLGRASAGAGPPNSYRPSIAVDGSKVVFETLADNLDRLHPDDRNGALDVLVADLSQFSTNGTLRLLRASLDASGRDADGASGGATIGSFSASTGGVETLTTHLLEKVLHPRCVNCHGFNSTPRPSTFPADHPGDSSTGSCNDCHCPSQTGIAEWEAPPRALSFHDKTVEQLCEQLQDPAGFPTARDHLLSDPRIQWALGAGGTTPCWNPTRDDDLSDCGGTNSRPAIPGGADGWAPQVEAWAAGGFQCRDFGASGGDVVAFTTAATNLGAAPNRTVLAFLQNVKVERVSKTSGYGATGGQQLLGDSSDASISFDDRYVVFATTAAVTTQDKNGVSDIYVRDLYFGTTVLVSHAAGLARAANGASTNPAICVDAQGRAQIVYESRATDLVAGFVDQNGAAGGDVYRAELGVYDPAEPSTIPVALVSVSITSANRGGDGPSSRPRVAADAYEVFVGFESAATDLFDGFVDANGAGADVFLRNESTGTVVLASHAFGVPLQGGNGASSRVAISRGATRVAFESLASNLVAGFVDGNGSGAADVFAFEGVSGLLTLISHADGNPVRSGDGGSSAAALDAAGSVVAFESFASDLVAGFVDANGVFPDVFVLGSAMALASRDPSVPPTDPPRGGNGGSSRPSLGADANAIAFESLATNLVADDALDALAGIYLSAGGVIRRLSESAGGANANAAAVRPCLGASGGSVVFETAADNVAAPGVDTNGTLDVYRRTP